MVYVAGMMKEGGCKMPLTAQQLRNVEDELPDVGVALHRMLYLQSTNLSA